MHFWHILILNYGNTQRTLLFIYLFLVQSPHFQAPLNLVPANPTGQEELSIVTTKSPNDGRHFYGTTDQVHTP